MPRKPRVFRKGDQVLLLLPTDANKLLMQWNCPCAETSRCGEGINYIVEVNKKAKTYANMLKQYIERKTNDETSQGGFEGSTCNIFQWSHLNSLEWRKHLL